MTEVPDQTTTKSSKEVAVLKPHKRRPSKSNNMPLSERKANTNKKPYIHNVNVKPNDQLLNRPSTPEGQMLKSKECDSSGAKRLAEFKRRLQERHINAAKNKEN
jgi:hypothetical protein